MSHPSDKDLDRMVRAAAEQYDAEQNASGWETLRQRLDMELPPGEDKDRRPFLWLLLLITALTGGGLVWMLTGSRTQQEILTHNTTGSPAKPIPVATATSHQQPVASADGANTTAQRLSRSEGPAQPRGEEDHFGLAKTHPASHANGGHLLRYSERKDSATTLHSTPVGSGSEQPARYGERETTNSKARINPAHHVSSNEPMVPQMGSTPASGSARMAPQMAGTPASGNSRPGNKKYSPKSSAALAASNRSKQYGKRSRSISGKTASYTDTKEDGNTTSMDNRKNGSSENLDPLNDQQSIKKQEGGIAGNETSAPRQNKLPSVTDSSHTAKAGVAEQADSNTTTTKKPVLPPSRERGWEIGLLAGPDISNVAFRNSNKTGYNLGLQLGYHFSRRWSVSAGIIYTKKNYDAQERDYHPSKPYSYPSTILDMVDGYCQMLDIPVNLRYNLATSPKATWFVSTGISSYFMKRQYYDFYQHNVYTGATRVYGWDNKTESNHLLSVLNISAGWERSLSKHFSMQAEPYLKMPLTGIGYGKMMINSYGLLLAIKYKPSFHSPGKR